MTRVKAVLMVVAVAAALATVVTIEQKSVSAVSVRSDAYGRQFQGGGCGFEWDSSKVACPTGTVLCGEESVSCTSQDFVSLVQDGDGDEVFKDGNTANACVVCNNKTCSYAKTTTQTKKCT